MMTETETEDKARKIEMVGVVTIDLGQVMMATDLVDQMLLGEALTAVVGMIVAEASMMTVIGTEIEVEGVPAVDLVNQGTISMGTNERSIGMKEPARTSIQMILVMTVEDQVGKDQRLTTKPVPKEEDLAMALIVTGTCLSMEETKTPETPAEVETEMARGETLMLPKETLMVVMTVSGEADDAMILIEAKVETTTMTVKDKMIEVIRKIDIQVTCTINLDQVMRATEMGTGMTNKTEIVETQDIMTITIKEMMVEISMAIMIIITVMINGMTTRTMILIIEEDMVTIRIIMITGMVCQITR